MARGGHYPEAEAADEDTGQVPCARGNRCEERDYAGNPNLGPRPWCVTDRRYVLTAITGLPKAYAELRLLLPAGGQSEERVSGSRDAPIPLATDIEAFMREIVHVALCWEEIVRDIARLSEIPRERRRDGVALAAASLTLQRQFETLLALSGHVVTRAASTTRVNQIIEEHGDDAPYWHWIRRDVSGQVWEHVTLDGTGAGLEFLNLSGRARGMLGLSRQRRRVTEVRCDTCKNKTLVQYEARDGGWEPRVRCTQCPNVYVGAGYDLLMGRIYSAQLKELGRRAEAS